MTARPNSLQAKPEYCLHRTKEGAPVAADSSDLDALFEEPDSTQAIRRGILSCKGWKSVQVLTVLEGGTTPTVDIQPLEHCKGDNIFPANTTKDEGFAVLASTLSGVVSGQLDTVEVNQGRLFLRIAAVGGGAAPTKVRFYVAGKERATSITGQS